VKFLGVRVVSIERAERVEIIVEIVQAAGIGQLEKFPMFLQQEKFSP